MKPRSPFISWVTLSRVDLKIEPFSFVMRLLPAVWRKTILPSFLYFHWLFPLSARETSPRNRSIYKSTRERVDSEGLKRRLHLIGCSQLRMPSVGLTQRAILIISLPTSKRTHQLSTFLGAVSLQMLSVVGSGVQKAAAIISRPSWTFKLIIFARIQAKGIPSLSLASLSFFLASELVLIRIKIPHVFVAYHEAHEDDMLCVCVAPTKSQLQNCRSYANGCNIVMLCFSAQGTKENVESHGWLKDLTSFKLGTTTPNSTLQHATFYHPKDVAIGF